MMTKRVCDGCFRAVLVGMLLYSVGGLPSVSQAQVTNPTSALGTLVTPVAVPGGTRYDITGGTRPGNPTGANLFHNFERFSLPGSSDIANFQNTTGAGITRSEERRVGKECR